MSRMPGVSGELLKVLRFGVPVMVVVLVLGDGQCIKRLVAVLGQGW